MTTDSPENNPYSPPRSDIKNNKTRKGSPKKAVIVACLVDIFGTFALSIILGFVYGLILALQGITQEEIANSYYSLGIFSPFSLIAITLGTSITIYAGYLCAKIGNRKDYKLITIYLVIVVVTMNFLLAIGGEDVSSLKNIILTTICILAGYFGGWLYIRNNA